jgi:integrase
VATIFTVRRAAKAHYRVQVRLRGAPPLTACFQSKTDAKKWAAQIESAIREGRYFHSSEARRHDLGELVERYLLEVNPQKPRGMRDRERHLRWWRHTLGHLKLADVTPVLLAEYRNRLLRSKAAIGNKVRSPGTVNRYLASLSHAFTIAVKDWGWLDDNPCRKVRRATEPRGRVRFLSEAERDALLAACKTSSNPYLYPLVVLAVSTGARRGELLGLRWRQVDLAQSVIRLDQTKNDDRRALPLSGLAMAAIRLLHAARRIDTDLVFPSLSGRRPLAIRKSWDGALARAGIHDFRFHDLRHTAASYLAMSGATLAEIAEVLGHKTLAMVKRYSHLSTAHVASVVSRMNDRFLPS